MRSPLPFVFLVASIVLVGAGCVAAPQASLDLPSTPTETAPAAASPANERTPSAPVPTGTLAPTSKSPYYIAYSDAEYRMAKAEGRPILLYFWASWCPICRNEEPKVKERVESSGVPIAGFRLNFDTEDALKQQFGINYQHTTVILNGKGEEVARFFGPTGDAEYAAAFAKAAR